VGLPGAVLGDALVQRLEERGGILFRFED